MRNEDVLSLVKTINDIALGAPITTEMVGDIKQWIRLEEEHGSSPSVTAIVKGLVRELEQARTAQTSVAKESAASSASTSKSETKASGAPARPGTGSRRLKQQPAAKVEEETPAEDAPTEASLGEENAPADEQPASEEQVLAGVGAEGTQPEAPASDGEW